MQCQKPALLGTLSCFQSLGSRLPHLWRPLQPATWEEQPPVLRATPSAWGPCLLSQGASPCALGFKYAISPCFCRKLVKKQIAQPTKCNGLYDLKQMLDSVAWIALPLQLSYFAKNYPLKFHFGKCLFLHSVCEIRHLHFLRLLLESSFLLERRGHFCNFTNILWI